MKLPPFDYRTPQHLDETIDLLRGGGSDEHQVILAGGQSVLPQLARRLIRPSRLIDINGLCLELGGSAWEHGSLRIGAMTRQRAVERDAQITRQFPVLGDALALVGRPAIRTRGTIGGSLAHADPAGEIPAVARALDAEMTVVGPGGSRIISAADFFVGPMATAISADELLTQVRLPVLPEGSGSVFLEVSRRYGDRCIVGVAAIVTLDRQAVADVRLAIANVGDTPLRASRAEAMLRGEDASPDAISAAAGAAAADLAPPSDQQATSAYRQRVAAVLVRRALATAIDRARGAA